MRTLIKIVRTRDQTVLEQEVAELCDATAVDRVIGDLLARIRKAHPRTVLRDFIITVGEGADKLA
jgi:hypothetical protein